MLLWKRLNCGFKLRIQEKGKQCRLISSFLLMSSASNVSQNKKDMLVDGLLINILCLINLYL